MFARSAALLALAVGMLAGEASAQGPVERTNRGVVEIVTGGSATTDLRIGEELAAVLDDGATRRVVPVVGKGSAQNLVDLRLLRGIDLGIIQTDVLALARSQRLPGVDGGSFTYITKLFNEEFHLLAGEGINSVADLEGKKVNLGLPGSGVAVTGPIIFQRLKVRVEPTSYDAAVALEKLKSGEIAAMGFIAGKPAPLAATLPAQSGLHLVAIPAAPELLNDYLPARLTAEDYPNLVKQPLDTIAVGTVLAVANLAPGTERYRSISNFVDAFFTQFSQFLEPPRHPKWREVNLSAELPGFRRFPAAETWLKNNAAPAPTVDEGQMKQMFTRFLDERSRLARGRTLSQEQKDEMFEEFKKWQSSAQRQ
jgi:TRAP transporter TAXI family solute receptor